MSAIAEFFLLPRTILPELAAEAGDPDFDAFLSSHAKSAVDFRWSGYIFNPLFPFLSKQIGMSPKNFEFAALAKELTEARETYYVIFASREREVFLSKLNPDAFSPQDLADFYNKFNGQSEPGAGEPMLAGIKALHDGLSQVDTSNALLFRLG